MYSHIPVMLGEVLEYLDPKPGDTIVDCTLGGAGYTMAIAAKVGQAGRVIAIDLDALAIGNAQALVEADNVSNVELVHDNFKNLASILAERGIAGVDGIVMDLGLSSAQLADRERGFSFLNDGPLDMSFGPEHLGPETYEIVNRYSAAHLAAVLRDLGEESQAWRIAQAIVRERKASLIETSSQLAELIAKTIGRSSKSRIHPATKTFQALRMETNQELSSLQAVLPDAVSALKIGGRLAIVSFHSGEDRIVKNFFRQESRDCLCPSAFPVCQCDHHASLEIVTKKALEPSEQEKEANPRSRSAKLRAAKKR